MRVAVAIVPEVRELLREQPSELQALLEEIHDEDLADLVKLLETDEALLMLEQLDPELAADIFARLDEPEQARFLERFGPARIAPIVNEMAPDDRADLIDALPELVGDELLETMNPEAVAEVEELAQWAEDTAGGLMTTEYISVPLGLTVQEVIERIREGSEQAETVYYVYVLDDDRRLLGIASIRDLLLASADDPLSEVMAENVHTVRPDTDQEVVARTLGKYDFVALPVTDEAGTLLGVITVDDVLDVLTAEQTEDVQRLGAVGPIEERYFQTTFWTFISKRAPWLAVLFMGEFLAGGVMRHYDPVLRAVAQLSHYIPLLISTGGNSGSQSASLIIRGMATGDITVGDWWRVLLRELGQGAILGVFLAAIGVGRVLMVQDGTGMAVTIGVTVVSIVLMGCTVGAMLPILLRRVGLDPATSSTPFIATLVDVLGILLYFTVAKLVLAEAIGVSSPAPG